VVDYCDSDPADDNDPSVHEIRADAIHNENNTHAPPPPQAPQASPLRGILNFLHTIPSYDLRTLGLLHENA
jgi:hypothetical protein